MEMEEDDSSESEEEVRPCAFLSRPFPIRPQEEFYTEGSLELLQARRRLAEYSLPRLDFTYQ
jgi:U4/U6 small nuclear ribonucleoprotein PRP4